MFLKVLGNENNKMHNNSKQNNATQSPSATLTYTTLPGLIHPSPITNVHLNKLSNELKSETKASD